MSFKIGAHRRKPPSNKEKVLQQIPEEKRDEKLHNFKWFQHFCLFSHIRKYNSDYLVKILYKPTCSSSLGIVRALFGLMMVIDIPDERGLANIDLRFGDSMRCHFPLFDWISPLPLEYMGLTYAIMWLGSLGICLGFKFRISCTMFIFPYWYIYLMDKSFWNNHSYLYGLVSVLFAFSCANYSFSLDALWDSTIRKKEVPLWNYAIIRFQFFLLYFYAGVKKFDSDWLGGYSMTRLGLHWVFEPFRLILNNEQIDFWIIHIFGFIFDLTIGFFLLIDKTRPVAIIFSTAFHLMNSCMFHIGQFPYVCLVTMPIFCSYDWPDQLLQFIGIHTKNHVNSIKKTSQDKHIYDKVTWKRKVICFAMALYVGVQLFLPYSHFLTQGYNNWTNGLYGYSWDMMVQNWNSDLVVVRVVDNYSKEEFYMDPEAWVANTRYSKHGDMLIQYAKCLKRNLNRSDAYTGEMGLKIKSFNNISIYVDIWCSLNGRFQQRMFNPKQDLLIAEWNPFRKISWLMPLLTDLSQWRQNLVDIQREVHKWSNYSEVLFVADFPGLHLENFIGFEYTNISVTVLQGTVILEQIDTAGSTPVNVTLIKGESSYIKEGAFHKIYTVSKEPACYMYTFNNHSLEKFNGQSTGSIDWSSLIVNEIFFESLSIRIENFFNSLARLRDCFLKLMFNVTIPKRYKEVL